MSRYVVRRLLQMVAVVFGVLTLVFLLIRLSGDPALFFVDAQETPDVQAKQREAVGRELGLDAPLHVQYGRFIWQAIRGDFGESFRYDVSAVGLVLQRLPASIRLGLTGAVMAVIIGLPLGVFAALQRGSILDSLATTVAVLGITTPNFFLGIMLIILFAVQFKLLPAFGSESWKHVILPAVTIAMSPMAQVARLGRSGMLEVLRQDYVRTARAKGLSEQVVIVRHALRNALLPVVTVLALAIPHLIGTMVVVETVFAWPGVGGLMMQSVFNRDYPVVLVSVLLLALLSIPMFLLMDLVYAFLDPRIRYE